MAPSGKQRGSAAVSVLLACLAIFQMLHMHVPELLHEIAGVLFGAVLLVHLVQHRSWFLVLTKGKWSPFRTVNTAVILGLLICSALTLVSGLAMSSWSVSAGLPGSGLARSIHLSQVHLCFCLFALHVGLQSRRALVLLHAQAKRGSIAKRGDAAKRDNNVKVWLIVVVGALGAYGAWSFAHLNFFDYILGLEGFAVIDPSKPLALSALQYLAVFILFAGVGYGIERLAREEKGDKHE